MRGCTKLPGPCSRVCMDQGATDAVQHSLITRSALRHTPALPWGSAAGAGREKVKTADIVSDAFTTEQVCGVRTTTGQAAWRCLPQCSAVQCRQSPWLCTAARAAASTYGHQPIQCCRC